MFNRVYFSCIRECSKYAKTQIDFTVTSVHCQIVAQSPEIVIRGNNHLYLLILCHIRKAKSEVGFVFCCQLSVQFELEWYFVDSESEFKKIEHIFKSAT